MIFGSVINEELKDDIIVTVIATGFNEEVIGFMLAIQFQTVQEPVVRDTRDVWELREALLKEKELNSNLNTEMRSVEGKQGPSWWEHLS